MIQVESLSIQYGGRFLFNNLSFTIKDRDRIGLVGKNGAGKSTLLKILIKENLPDEGRVSMPNSTELGYLPQEMKLESEKTVYNETATAFDEVLALEKKIEDLNNQIAEFTDYDSPQYYKLLDNAAKSQERLQYLGGMNIRAEVEKVLKGLGFVDGDFDRKMSEFSGGWQMRVELAKILLRAPHYILLDEPTNHLDIESIIWLENFLKDYPGGILLISHDQRFLDTITNRTMEIVNGKIYDYTASYTKFLTMREQRREQQINEKKRQDKFVEHTEQLINKFRAKKNKAAFAQTLMTKLEKLEKIEVDDTENAKLSLKFPPAPRSGREVIRCDKLIKKYDDFLVLDGLDFLLERGEKVAFVGKNGEGKSTLSKVIVGRENYEGKMVVGHNVDIGYFEQNQAESLDHSKTVFQTIDDEATGEMRNKVRALLGAFLFSGEDADKKVSVLSGGEKSRLAMAKLLLHPYNLLVLDEPTNHLDMRSKDILKQAIANYDGSVIIVSHDREFLKGLTDKVFEFKNRNIKEHLGDLQSFLDKRKIEDLDDLGMKSTIQATKERTSESVKKSSQELYELDKSIKKLKNRVGKYERDISDKEKEIKELEKEMADPDFYMKNPKANEILHNYEKLKESLDVVMEKWEEATIEMEELQEQRDI